MSNYPEHLLTSALAAEGDKTIPPATSQEAGTGRFSQNKGWTEVNSMPLAEGGIPPKRQDFNGAFYLLSQLLLWYQQGGVMNYSVDLDYEVGNEVMLNGTKYRCLRDNGPGTSLVTPGSSKAVWKNLDAPSVIAGQITPFANCRLGGSDGRRLIPWGETAADERYVLCDGGSDGLGGTVPDLIGKFILPSTVGESGQVGGKLTAGTDDKKIAGTVGETILTVDQIPSHSHTGKAAAVSGHTHSRGTMNITGSFPVDDHKQRYVTGSFYAGEWDCWDSDNRDSENTSVRCQFDAARTWTGRTSTDGAHSHDVTLDSVGGNQGHTHTLDGASHSHTVKLPLPPFFKLAFFVKLPE